MECKSLYMWTLNLYIFVYWLLYIQFITSPQWKYIDAFRLVLEWLSYLFLFKSNMLFTLLLILSSNQQFYLNLIIHSHPSEALCCQPTLCLDMVSHLTPSRPELYMGRGETVNPGTPSGDFPSESPHFGELNIEYRACSLTTPSLSRALPTMAKWPCPKPANTTQMCRLFQACTLTNSFGARRQIASHWLRVLVN